MASRFIIYFLLFLLPLVSIIPTVKAAVDVSNTKGVNVDMISNVLSDKGFDAMSLVLDMTLKALIATVISHNTTVTIFCPPDKAFFSLKYPQPPFTLLQYHVAPLKLDREALESSLPLGSKLDTLLPGHPLVVTTYPDSKRASINEIKITEWDLYNDGRVIVHGVEDFFDPAFQTLRYPWYDDGLIKNDIEGRVSGSSALGIMKGSSKGVGGSSWLKDVMYSMAFLLVTIGIGIAGCLLLAYTYCLNHRDEGYVYVESDVGV